MDLQVLEYGKKKRKWGFVLGALGFTCYTAYRVYTLPCVVSKRQRFSKLFSAFLSVAETISHSSEAIGILSKDFKQFLGSDSDQIPQSFKQLSKIAKSHEFSDSLTTIARALAVGILLGYQPELIKDGIVGGSGFSDRVFSQLFSDAGSGFASVVVGSFARNMVMALCTEWQQSDQHVLGLVEAVYNDKCREIIGDFIRVFVSSALTVYLDKTMEINALDEFFHGLTNPKHEDRVRDILASLCNGAVETCIQTSYNVWTMDPKMGSTCSKKLQGKKVVEKNQESGLMRKMCSTLAVSSNRKFVIDMTGIVTFETVRSFLEFVLDKLLECMKKSVDVVHQEMVDRGFETIRYASVKSSAVSTLCLTLCLNILNSPWILAPSSYACLNTP